MVGMLGVRRLVEAVVEEGAVVEGEEVEDKVVGDKEGEVGVEEGCTDTEEWVLGCYSKEKADMLLEVVG